MISALRSGCSVRPRRLCGSLSIAVVALTACVDAPATPPDLAKPRPREPNIVAQPAPNPPPPPIAEVEISGRVTVPPDAKGDAIVYTTDGPCWQADTRAFGQVKVISLKEGYFFVEIFVPQGTHVWLCAALVDGDKPVTVHGELANAPLLGKGVGEVVHGDLRITLAKGARVSLPVRRAPAGTAGPLPPKTGPAAPPKSH
jgi:hypothetical protein